MRQRSVIFTNKEQIQTRHTSLYQALYKLMTFIRASLSEVESTDALKTFGAMFMYAMLVSSFNVLLLM